MEVRTSTATTVTEVIEAIKGFRERQRDGQDIWFRGSYCSRHVLLPSLMREPGRTSDEVFALEASLITMYRQRSLPFWPEGYPQTDWEHMFSMQHHGLQTRLLDWSENAFVGLWFSVDGDCNKEHECSPILWLLDPQELNRVSLAHVHEQDSRVPILTTADEDIKSFAPATVTPPPRRIKSAVAMYGTHNSARISAQRGVFTIGGKELTPLEDFISGSNDFGHPVLEAIHLTADSDTYRRELAMLGFSTSMVYPDLPGLARDLSGLMSRL